MNLDANVIWRKGDNEMPEHAKHVVVAAQDEILLKTLRLPLEIVGKIRYNADKNAQSVNDYISALVAEHFRVA